MALPFEAFLANLEAVRGEIAAACAGTGRDPAEVSILPVTKNQPAEVTAHVAQAGLPAVGENRVQEARAKQPLAPSVLQWELIGHLQSNKARLAATLFSRIQSVDRTELLDRLDRAVGES